jgi:hypothetical protein
MSNRVAFVAVTALSVTTAVIVVVAAKTAYEKYWSLMGRVAALEARRA